MSARNRLRQPEHVVRLLPAGDDEALRLGVLGLRCRVKLLIERTELLPTPLEFVVDSGASYSVIALVAAERLFLPLPPPESETTLRLRTARGLSTLRVLPGRIRVWWNTTQEGYPFDWPVLFQIDASLGVPPILGLGGVVNTCRWCFDGSYAPAMPHGHLHLHDFR